MYLFVHKQSLYDHLHHESSTSLSLRTFYRRSMGCRIALHSQGDHWSDCQGTDKQPQKLRNSFSILFLIRKRAPEQGFGPAAHAVSARAVTKGNILSLDRFCLTVGTENSASLGLALPNMSLAGACPPRTASLRLPLGQCSCLLTLSRHYWQGQGACDPTWACLISHLTSLGGGKPSSSYFIYPPSLTPGPLPHCMPSTCWYLQSSDGKLCLPVLHGPEERAAAGTETRLTVSLQMPQSTVFLVQCPFHHLLANYITPPWGLNLADAAGQETPSGPLFPVPEHRLLPALRHPQVTSQGWL